MHKSYLKGFGYGLTSGVITTLGLMVGLNAGTGSRVAVLGGILVIAIGDAMSDALGMHISEESVSSGSEKSHTDVWRATFSTFIFKFLFSSIFVLPIILLPLDYAVWTSVIIGLLLIGIFSYLFVKRRGENPLRAVAEHIFIAIIVIVLTTLVGDLVAYLFN